MDWKEPAREKLTYKGKLLAQYNDMSNGGNVLHVCYVIKECCFPGHPRKT